MPFLRLGTLYPVTPRFQTGRPCSMCSAFLHTSEQKTRPPQLRMGTLHRLQNALWLMYPIIAPTTSAWRKRGSRTRRRCWPLDTTVVVVVASQP